MIRKTTVIVASGDADTQWRRIRKSAELRAEHPTERGNLSRIQARIIEQRLINAYGMEKYGGALFNKRNEIGHQYWIRYGIINN